MAAGASLARNTTTADIDENIILVCSLCEHERLLYCVNAESINKVLFKGLSVDSDLAITLPEIDTGYSSLAAANAVSEIYNFFLAFFLSHLFLSLKFNRDGLLCGMRVLTASIDLEISEQCPAQLSMGKHALDGVLHGEGRLPLNYITVGFNRESAGEH